LPAVVLYPRKRIDLGAADLAYGLWALLAARRRAALAARVEARFVGDGEALMTMSARSALDLWLTALDLPAGSEVLLSALTIPDMARIVEAHGLTPVPVDVQPHTLLPEPADVLRAAGPNTRVLITAPLFGCRPCLRDLARLARERGWLFVEDAAQAFTGAPERSPADLVLYSFGSIKTATAAAGGVAVLRDPETARRMRALAEVWPVQRRWDQARRLLRTGLLALLGSPRLYGLFAAACDRLGRDHDTLVRGWVRGYPGPNLLQRLRRRPSAPLAALLLRRLGGDVAARVRARAQRGRELVSLLGPHGEPGGALAIPGVAAPSTHWVFAVTSREPQTLVQALRRAGFDATRRASLAVVPAPPGHQAPPPSRALELLEHLVFLPTDTPLPPPARQRLLAVLQTHARAPQRQPS
jgi:perosamine synthetase